MIAEVKTIYSSNARDMPEMLRRLANEIEERREKDKDNLQPDCGVCILFHAGSGSHVLYGWGDTDIHKSISFLEVAKSQLVDIVREGGYLWPVTTGGVK